MSHMDAGISPVRIQRAMPAAVQRFILPAITPKPAAVVSASTARINMPSTSNTNINAQSTNNNSDIMPPPIKKRRTENSTGPAYTISPSCGLLKFELLSEKFFDKTAVRNFVECVPTLLSVSVNESFHEDLERQFVGSGRRIEVCSFAPALRKAS
ncbi:hypothetical protein DL89DRAFT_264033 [Linderina pennispora]|uniref:Uncharacterized protein n=1 Tax=Linderina pennispora TaxID=61395 RepID=A0A1Y1WLI5_9FUNG|nr:uncharacterized protein DL89DRAFT_264033 [Linderina pennispora]ORX74046.1 hypothetical protein DL89DRAFT_264033 [Linderina pennispora]